MEVRRERGKWVVALVNESRILGEHDHKADAERQLRAAMAGQPATVCMEAARVEMGWFRKGDRVQAIARLGGWRGTVVVPDMGGAAMVEVRRDDGSTERVHMTEIKKDSEHASKPTVAFQLQATAGAVRSGVWDLVCVPGSDYKDGQSTEFNDATLTQMVENFRKRGDAIPLDHNHQSNYASQNGQPAPALAFYGAVAVVSGGKILALARARDVTATGQEPGLDLASDGLWAFRSQVTPLGQELLPNFKYLSPTFQLEATDREGNVVGYQLAAVAATNTPWQSGTAITFEPTSSQAALKAVAERARAHLRGAGISLARAFAGVGVLSVARQFAEGDKFRVGDRVRWVGQPDPRGRGSEVNRPPGEAVGRPTGRG